MMPAVGRNAVAQAPDVQQPDTAEEQSLAPRSMAPAHAFFDLPRLPPELRGEVALRLTPRAAAALVQTSPDMRASFSDAATAARLGHVAKTADLPTIERLLNDPAGIAALPAALRTGPGSAASDRLGDLTTQLKELPEPARTPPFDKILRLASQLSGREQAIPLTLLAAAIPHLPEPDRHARFAALLDQAPHLSDADQSILEAQLAEVIQTLAATHRADGFRQVLRTAGDRAGKSRRKFIQTLRHQLPHLPAADQLTAFRSLVNQSRGRGTQGAWEVNHLISYFAGLPMGAKHEAFRALTDRLGSLPDDDPIRLQAAVSMSHRIQDLPPASRDEAARQVAEVLRPLHPRLHIWVLARSDAEVPPAVKNALRQAASHDTQARLSRAGTSARA